MADISTEFQKKLLKIGVNGLTAGGLALGRKLKLFHALAEVSSEESPATAEQVAAVSDCKERYVKEWLCMMATADIIEVNEEEKFWIKQENVKDLTEDCVPLMYSSFLPCFLGGFNTLSEVFQKNGPLGMDYKEFDNFYDLMDSFTVLKHGDMLIKGLLPKLDENLTNRLSEGPMMVLDVGCGSGFQSALLAESFPNSNFTGIDITLHAVLAANQKRKDDGRTFDNLAFVQMDARRMDEDWTDKFDLVLIFDACHDQMRPDLCLQEIYRVLKPGGIFAMVEPKGFSNVHTDKEKLGDLSTVIYGCSVYHCLPVASNSEDALGLGAAWGCEKALKLLKEAGFKDPKVVNTPESTFNQLYVCKK